MTPKKAPDLNDMLEDLMGEPVTAALEDVTPEQAAEWLKANTRNRPTRPNLIARYARDMAAGRWTITGEAVKFDRDGALLDGQHRLMAIVEAGATVSMMVVRGPRSR